MNEGHRYFNHCSLRSSVVHPAIVYSFHEHFQDPTLAQIRAIMPQEPDLLNTCLLANLCLATGALPPLSSPNDSLSLTLGPGRQLTEGTGNYGLAWLTYKVKQLNRQYIRLSSEKIWQAHQKACKTRAALVWRRSRLRATTMTSSLRQRELTDPESCSTTTRAFPTKPRVTQQRAESLFL